MPRSRWISLNMLSSDGGTGTPGSTEKHNPCAWPAPWYGSWPSTTTFTASNGVAPKAAKICRARSEEHTSELQSLMRTSYAVFCLKKKKLIPITHQVPHGHRTTTHQ